MVHDEFLLVIFKFLSPFVKTERSAEPRPVANLGEASGPLVLGTRETALKNIQENKISNSYK